MKIGIDVTSAVRQGAGIGRYTRELLSGLARVDAMRAHSIRLVAAATQPLPHPLPPLPDNFDFRRIPVHDVWLARAWHRLQLPIPVELATGRVDVFHSPDFTLPPTLPRTRTLLTVHDLSFVRDPGSAATGLLEYLKRVVPRSIRRAEHVLADSEKTRLDILELYGTPADRVSVLYPGVGRDFQCVTDAPALAQVRGRYGFGSWPFILAVSTLQPRKNYVRLVQAFARLPSDDLRLVFAGGPGWSFDAIYAEVSRLHLEQRVHFLGFVDDRDLPALYSASRVLAYPSLVEGFGLPMLEAMACGTPVVASNASCLPEVAGDAALLPDPYDVEAIADALRRAVYDDSLRKRLVEAGQRRAAEFSWDRAARELVGHYVRLHDSAA